MQELLAECPEDNFIGIVKKSAKEENEKLALEVVLVGVVEFFLY